MSWGSENLHSMLQVSTSERAAPVFYFSGSSKSTVGILAFLNMALIGAVVVLSRRTRKQAGAEFEAVKTYGSL
jgi:hypothetical protein